MLEQQSQIEQRADRDEEQSQQDVAERADDDFDLMSVFRFREQHAGEKRAERHRQARQHASPTPHRARQATRSRVNRSVLRERPISWNNGRTSHRRKVSTNASATAARSTALADRAEIEVLGAAGKRALERQQRDESEILKQQNARRRREHACD